MRAQVAAEESACWLCGGLIDFTLPAFHDWAFEIDHVHPLSLGGSNTRDNFRAAHRICNLRRSNGPAEQAPRRRSRDW